MIKKTNSYSQGTALMVAAIEGHDEIVKLLVDNGADINITNNERYTALDWAQFKIDSYGAIKFNKQNNYRNIIDCLKSHGAKSRDTESPIAASQSTLH